MSSFLMVGVAAVVAEARPGWVEALGVPAAAVVVAAAVEVAVTPTGS